MYPKLRLHVLQVKTLSLPLYSLRPLLAGRGWALAEISDFPIAFGEDSNNLPATDLEFPLLSSFTVLEATAAPPMRLAMASAAAAAADAASEFVDPPLLAEDCCCTMLLRNSRYIEAVSSPLEVDEVVGTDGGGGGTAAVGAGGAELEAKILLLFSFPVLLLVVEVLVGNNKGSLGGGRLDGKAPAPKEAIEAANGFMNGAAPAA